MTNKKGDQTGPLSTALIGPAEQGNAPHHRIASLHTRLVAHIKPSSQSPKIKIDEKLGKNAVTSRKIFKKLKKNRSKLGRTLFILENVGENP